MKRMGLFTFLIMSLLTIETTAQPNKGMDIKIEGLQAQGLYQALIGPATQEEGAAGHIYRVGKSVLCIRTNADMDDTQGKLIPPEDPRRYVCKIHFDNNGFAQAPTS